MTGWHRLGEAVQGRRRRLGLSQEEVTERSGPSHSTLRRIERGDPGPYQGRTLVALERALGWRSGTARAILGGDDFAEPDVEATPLIDAEHRALELIAEAWNLITTEVIQPGNCAHNDVLELSMHVHAIQNMLLAQAAARAYPDRYRLLGGSVR